MTGSKAVTHDLDVRKRRIIFRAWHRGIREMDLILGQYVDAHIADMSEEDLDELELIMEHEDRDLLTWATGEIIPPKNVDTPLFRDILDYRTRMDFA